MCGRDDEQDKHSLTAQHKISGGLQSRLRQTGKRKASGLRRSSTTAQKEQQRTKEGARDNTKHTQTAADDRYTSGHGTAQHKAQKRNGQRLTQPQQNKHAHVSRCCSHSHPHLLSLHSMLPAPLPQLTECAAPAHCWAAATSLTCPACPPPRGFLLVLGCLRLCWPAASSDAGVGADEPSA